MVESDRPQMAIWRMCIAYWTPKTTDTYSEYTMIIAFPLPQWWRKPASMLCLYVQWLSCF